MKQRRTIQYALSLSVLALLCGATLTVGTAQARYAVGTVWNTAVQTKAAEVSSDLLAAGGQHILLNDLSVTDTRALEMSFTASGGDATGKLTCTADQPTYLATQLSEHDVTLTEGETKTVTLSLGPTEAAKTITQATSVSVRVTWTNAAGGTLTGDVTVTLLPSDTVGSTSPIIIARGSEATIRAMTTFSPQAALAVVVGLPTDATATLSLTDAAFPAMTRCRIGSDGVWTVLPDGGSIPLSGAADDQYPLLLDFSDTNVTWQADTPLSMTLTTTTAQTDVYTDVITVSPDMTFPASPAITPPLIFTAASGLTLDIPPAWGGCERTVTVSHRTDTGWQPAENMAVTVADTAVTLSADTERPPAGTYRLTVLWQFQGLTVHQMDVTFFANYSAFLSQAVTGGAEQ